MPGLIKGYAGAIAGAAFGYFVFGVLLRQGFYALALPGATIGLLCGFLSGIKSVHLAIVCGLLSLGMCLFVEWQNFPFKADDSFSYFLANVMQLKGGTKLLIALGTLFGAWFGLGRERFATPEQNRPMESSASGE